MHDIGTSPITGKKYVASPKKSKPGERVTMALLSRLTVQGTEPIHATSFASCDAVQASARAGAEHDVRRTHFRGVIKQIRPSGSRMAAVRPWLAKPTLLDVQI